MAGSGRRAAARPTNRSMRFIHRTGTPVTVYIPPTGAPDADATSRCTPSGMGRSPARVSGRRRRRGMVGVDPGAGPEAGARLRRLLGRRAAPATATMDVLTAGVRIAVMLRDGLTAPAAAGAARRLRELLGAEALGLVD